MSAMHYSLFLNHMQGNLLKNIYMIYYMLYMYNMFVFNNDYLFLGAVVAVIIW